MTSEASSAAPRSNRGFLFTPWGLALITGLIAGAVGLSVREQDTGVQAESLKLQAGQIRLLTYNVAGLPKLVSKSRPHLNHPLISPRLNEFDIALVQEDFAFHEELAKDCRLPFQSQPGKKRRLVNDGLNRFSRFEFTPVQRERWRTCSGYLNARSDCFADKGFSWARTRLTRSASIDIYNLHADSGGKSSDIKARVQQFDQLADAIVRLSQGHAVIVAGDTNLSSRRPEDGIILDQFLNRLGLKDLASATNHSGVASISGLDRILYRSSEQLSLLPVAANFAQGFSDSKGRPLSDHPPLTAVFQWSAQKP